MNEEDLENINEEEWVVMGKDHVICPLCAIKVHPDRYLEHFRTHSEEEQKLILGLLDLQIKLGEEAYKEILFQIEVYGFEGVKEIIRKYTEKAKEKEEV